MAEPSIWSRGPWRSIQVNVDALGRNIVGDLANEPSIAIDPTDPCKMAIGWRQFDTIESEFRQAGWGYSHDRGETWTFTGSLAPGTFGSDPVLDYDADGAFYYLSLRSSGLRLFRSLDGGVTWDRLLADGLGYGDKPWMAIDRTTGIGRGNIYVMYGSRFLRSTNGGATFVQATENPFFWQGTLTVGPAGEVYAASDEVIKSVNAQDPEADPTFEDLIDFRDAGPCVPDSRIPDAASTSTATRIRWPCCGLCYQDWVATDHSTGQYHGNVYVLDYRSCIEVGLFGDIVIYRSTDGGTTWDTPRPVTDDGMEDPTSQWFKTMSVAPNGRIDVVWNDDRNSAVASRAELFYSYSTDAGETWSKNRAVSPMFDSCTGGGKLGDYYDMISDNAVANVAYAATFNGEHDVYFLRVGDCNDNGIHDSEDLAEGTAYDCNENALLDECERGDADGNEQVNLRDFADFANCYTGSTGPARPHDGSLTVQHARAALGHATRRESAQAKARGSRGREFARAEARGSGLYADPCCGIMDFDTDGDVDLPDFAAFSEALNEAPE